MDDKQLISDFLEDEKPWPYEYEGQWEYKTPQYGVVRDIQRKNHQENKTARNINRRKNLLKQKYDLTPAQYADMLSTQEGVCAICGGVNKNGQTLSIDHNHETGKVRALLCGKCNSMLGFAQDSANMLHKGALYIKRHAQIKKIG